MTERKRDGLFRSDTRKSCPESKKWGELEKKYLKELFGLLQNDVQHSVTFHTQEAEEEMAGPREPGAFRGEMQTQWLVRSQRCSKSLYKKCAPAAGQPTSKSHLPSKKDAGVYNNPHESEVSCKLPQMRIIVGLQNRAG